MFCVLETGKVLSVAPHEMKKLNKLINNPLKLYLKTVVILFKFINFQSSALRQISTPMVNQCALARWRVKMAQHPALLNVNVLPIVIWSDPSITFYRHL